jgi:hypothetical protein
MNNERRAGVPALNQGTRYTSSHRAIHSALLEYGATGLPVVGEPLLNLRNR